MITLPLMPPLRLSQLIILVVLLVGAALALVVKGVVLVWEGAVWLFS